MTQSMSGLSRSLGLAWDLAQRNIAGRYGNSVGGVLWLVVTPVSFAAIYWMVFGYFLKLNWVNPVTGVEVPYIAPLFAGLATYLLLTDIVISSLSTFRQLREFVRRAAVPLWVLWLSTVFRVGIRSAINFLVLAALALLTGQMSVSVLAATPLALLLIAVTAMAISLFLSVLGAFFSDLDELSRIVLRVLFYTSPVTYPLSIVPERFVSYLWVNPITVLVETVRDAFVFGLPPPVLPYVTTLVFSVALFAVSSWLYSRLRGAIVDVV